MPFVSKTLSYIRSVMRFCRARNTFDEEKALEPLTLPRFSFEENEQDRISLISTDQVFQHLSNGEIAYDPGTHLLLQDVKDVREIKVICQNH
jgi:hypothetical protein